VILATVGTQLPFPRFIDLLDEIAGTHRLEIVAQTCDPAAAPAHLKAVAQLAPVEFDRLVAECTVLVGHAGIGTVLSALKAGKPVILFPRHSSLGEHRNDHQIATAESFRDRDGIYVADDREALERYLVTDDLTAAGLRPTARRTALVERLRAFIDG
jgi:UDP-N-acetylglucosamine transferase subunit ALG13